MSELADNATLKSLRSREQVGTAWRKRFSLQLARVVRACFCYARIIKGSAGAPLPPRRDAIAGMPSAPHRCFLISLQHTVRVNNVSAIDFVRHSVYKWNVYITDRSPGRISHRIAASLILHS